MLWKGLEKNLQELLTVLPLVAALGACTTYDIEVQDPSTHDDGQKIADPSKLPTAFQLAQPYVSVYADMSNDPQTTLKPCEDSWVDSTLRTRARQLAVTVDIAPTAPAADVKIPLYTVTDGTSSGCMAQYTNSYVFPRQQIDPRNYFSLPIDTLAQDNSTENILGYIHDAAALAAIIAPAAAPAAGTAVAITGSAQAQAVNNDINQYLSNRIGVSKSVILVDPLHFDLHDETMTYNIKAYPYDRNFQPTGGPAIELATLKLHVQWAHSVVGSDTNAGVQFQPNLSMASAINLVDPDGVGRMSSISNHVAQAAGSAGTETLVETLKSTDTASSIHAICENFRHELSGLNDLDQAAVLWIAYSQSDLATKGNNTSSDNQPYPCLAKPQIDALVSMGLTESPGAVAPAPAPAPAPPGNIAANGGGNH